MGMSLGTQRSHLPLCQCSIIMKALQCSSSKPFPFREARNLEIVKRSHHVRIGMSSPSSPHLSACYQANCNNAFLFHTISSIRTKMLQLTARRAPLVKQAAKLEYGSFFRCSSLRLFGKGYNGSLNFLGRS